MYYQTHEISANLAPIGSMGRIIYLHQKYQTNFMSMVWSPYLTFFFHNSTHDTQGSIVVELVAETVPNTLLAFTSRGADLTVRRNNGDAMAMVFVQKSDETKYLLAQFFNIYP